MALGTELHLDKDGLPMAGSQWRDDSGGIHVVIRTTNRNSAEPSRVVFDTAAGDTDVLPLDEFLSKFEMHEPA